MERKCAAREAREAGGELAPCGEPVEPWCSLHKRERALPEAAELLDAWPVERPADWLALVNEPQDEAELAALPALSQSKGV